MIKLYIDADSLPTELRAMMLRRIIRHGYEAWFVADRMLPDVMKAIECDKAERRRPFRDTLSREEARRIGSGIRMVVVEKGENSADDEIVRIAQAPALAITHDIPLSERLIQKGLLVIDDRGNEYTAENIRERMSQRSNSRIFREMGLYPDRQRKGDARTVRLFAEAFDSALQRLGRMLAESGG